MLQGKQRPRFAAHMARQANGDGTEAAAAAPVRRTPVVRESWGQGAWDTARNRRGAGGDEVVWMIAISAPQCVASKFFVYGMDHSPCAVTESSNVLKVYLHPSLRPAVHLKIGLHRLLTPVHSPMLQDDIEAQLFQIARARPKRASSRRNTASFRCVANLWNRPIFSHW